MQFHSQHVGVTWPCWSHTAGWETNRRQSDADKSANLQRRGGTEEAFLCIINETWRTGSGTNWIWLPLDKCALVQRDTLPSRTDLVVHDSAQAHDADVDVVFLADQPWVFQSSTTRQRVATKTDDGKDENKSVIKENQAVFYLNRCRLYEHLSTNTSALEIRKTDAISEWASST